MIYGTLPYARITSLNPDASMVIVVNSGTLRQERIPCAPNFEKRTQDETLKQERCARREAWDLAKDVCKLKKRGQKVRFTLLPKPG